MKLIDANIFIYSADNTYRDLRLLFRLPNVFFASITKIEVLGFHRLTLIDRVYFEAVFASLSEIQLSEPILQKAIELRQMQKMSLGDAITGATALIYNLELNTRNIADFDHVPGLSLVNPII